MLEKAKSMLGMDEEEENEELEEAGFEDFEEDWEDEELVEDEEEEVEEEPEPEWDTVYRMLDDVVKERGFSGLNECIEKCMAMRVRESGLFRDRIQSGLDTIEAISEAEEKLSAGEGGNEIQQAANMLEDANELVEATEEFTNSEEMVAQQAMSVVNKGIETYKEVNKGGGSSGGSPVSVSTNEHDEEI